MKTVAKDKLWWDQGGQTACERHMPYRGSDTLVWDHWRRITAKEAPSL